MTIQNAPIGVDAESWSSVTLNAAVVRGCGTGVQAHAAWADATLVNSLVFDNTFGVHAWGAEDDTFARITLANSTVSGNGTGVRMDTSGTASSYNYASGDVTGSSFS
jgi:hypothetical protein